MSLKIEALPQLTAYQPPRVGETGERILTSHRRAKTTAALVAGVKQLTRANQSAKAMVERLQGEGQ